MNKFNELSKPRKIMTILIILMIISVIISVVVYVESKNKKCTPEELEENPNCSEGNIAALIAACLFGGFIPVVYFAVLAHEDGKNSPYKS